MASQDRHKPVKVMSACAGAEPDQCPLQLVTVFNKVLFENLSLGRVQASVQTAKSSLLTTVEIQLLYKFVFSSLD